MSMSVIEQALAEFKPQVRDSYANMVTNLFVRMQVKLGPRLKGVGNSWEYARVWNRLVGQFARNTIEGYVLNVERLARVADEYAELAVAEWQAKIEKKLGELEAAEVLRLAGAYFQIKGERAGHRVLIIQQMIINVSSRGLPFNQFPARIKVDGKAISEAAYQRLFERQGETA